MSKKDVNHHIKAKCLKHMRTSNSLSMDVRSRVWSGFEVERYSNNKMKNRLWFIDFFSKTSKQVNVVGICLVFCETS